MISIKKYAAIDVGSNAMRLLITNIVEQEGKETQFNKSSLIGLNWSSASLKASLIKAPRLTAVSTIFLATSIKNLAILSSSSESKIIKFKT